MSLWTIAEEKRIAALAARDAYWRILERHKARMERGDESLAGAKDEARATMMSAELDYSAAATTAEKSGEPHPEDADGR